jgi:hypothetical protein
MKEKEKRAEAKRDEGTTSCIFSDVVNFGASENFDVPISHIKIF